MESLQTLFESQGGRDIHAIARYIQQHVDQQWETVFQQYRDKMLAAYDDIGEAVYGMYGLYLFRPVHAQFKQVGLKATPRLPGNLDRSREWGSEDDRQRWMWSKLTSTEDGQPIGTLVTVYYHDHIVVRVPRAPRIICLEVVHKAEVIAVLSAHSVDFSQALDARAEYALYLQSLETESSEQN
jgi:hypothetical protein